MTNPNIIEYFLTFLFLASLVGTIFGFIKKIKWLKITGISVLILFLFYIGFISWIAFQISSWD